MEPVSALIFAAIVAWFIVRSAGSAAASQVRIEARAAARAIRDDLQARGETWADQLFDRLGGDRSGGPSTGAWWLWAAARTATALRDALTDDAPVRAAKVRGPRNPYQRIWDAGARGARFA